MIEEKKIEVEKIRDEKKQKLIEDKEKRVQQ